jgi:hypothetical protein
VVPRASGLVFMFALQGTFSAIRRASGSISCVCATRFIFGGTAGVVSRFHVLRARTHFHRYRGRRVPFSCFKLPDSFSAVSSASGPIFIFCATGLIFGGTEGVRSRFHVFRSRTCFRQCGGRRVPFSCFAIHDTFSVVSGASGPVFIFCDPEHVFGGTEGVGSRYHVFAPGLIFGGTEGIRSHFHVLRSRARFRQYRGRWV